MHRWTEWDNMSLVSMKRLLNMSTH